MFRRRRRRRGVGAAAAAAAAAVFFYRVVGGGGCFVGISCHLQSTSLVTREVLFDRYAFYLQ